MGMAGMIGIRSLLYHSIHRIWFGSTARPTNYRYCGASPRTHCAHPHERGRLDNRIELYIRYISSFPRSTTEDYNYTSASTASTATVPVPGSLFSL